MEWSLAEVGEVSEQPWDYLVSVEVVSELHAKNIERFGGDPTADAVSGCVEGSLGAA